MITALNPSSESPEEVSEPEEASDAFNQAVILNSQYVRNLSNDQEQCHSQSEPEEEQRLSIIEMLEKQG